MRKNFGPKAYVYPLPVLVIGSYDQDGTPDAMNVAYGGVVNSNRVQINIGVRHKTSDNIKETKAFTMGIADLDTMIAADYVGIVSGKEVPNKVEKAGFHVEKSEHVNAPIFTELPITLECKVEEINQYDQTLRIVAEIVNTSALDKVLDKKGEIDPKKLKAITYDPVHHDYIELGKKVGKAFDCGKKLE